LGERIKLSRYSELTRWISGDLSTMFPGCDTSRVDGPKPDLSIDRHDNLARALEDLPRSLNVGHGLGALALFALLFRSRTDEVTRQCWLPFVDELLGRNPYLGGLAGRKRLSDLGIVNRSSLFDALTRDEIELRPAPRSLRDLPDNCRTIVWDHRPWNAACPQGNLLVWTVNRPEVPGVRPRVDRALPVTLCSEATNERCLTELEFVGSSGLGLIKSTSTRETTTWQTPGASVLLSLPRETGSPTEYSGSVSWSTSADRRIGIEFTEPYDSLLREIARGLAQGEGDYLYLTHSVRDALVARGKEPNNGLALTTRIRGVKAA